MAQLAKTHRDQLERIKSNVDASIERNQKNAKRYWDCRNFVYKSAMTDEDTNMALDLGRPTLESNVLEPYISRQVGEMSKQLPDPMVSPKMQADPNMINQAEVYENHTRHTFDKAKNIRIDCFENAASGGFYVFKVCTDYLREDRFEQGIFIRRVHDVTKCGFDPMAQESHKGDGRYCFDNIPKIKEEFEEEYPEVDLNKVDFDGNESNWFYTSGKGDNAEKIVMVCDYYEKKPVYKDMVWVSNPLHPDALISMFVDGKDGYDALVAKAVAEGKTAGEIPKIVRKGKRKTTVIVNYKFTGKEVLEHKETDLKYLPLINCDGNGKKLKSTANSTMEEMTRPLVYHAMDPQKARNMSFQALLNDVENQTQTDEYLPVAGLPTKGEHLKTWMEPQKKHIAKFWNHKDENGDEIPPPQRIPGRTVDPANIQIYEMMGESIQQSMGSYDTQQGVQTPNMSGEAIKSGSLQSNNAMMPYVINYIEAWTQAARICVNLIPKYYTTLMSIPVIDREGKQSYQLINNSLANPSYKLEASEDDMDVTVKMDLSFEAQKQVALENITQAMKFSPDAQAFFGGPGFHFVLDNMTFRDVAKVKEEFKEYMDKKAANAAQAQQAAMATNPVIVQKQIAEMKMESDEKDRKVDLIKTIAETKIAERKLEVEESAAQAKILESRDKVVIAAMGQSAENKRSDADLAIALDKHAYDKIQSEREHALKVRDSDRGHVLDMVGMIGDLKNENSEKQKAGEEGQSDEEG